MLGAEKIIGREWCKPQGGSKCLIYHRRRPNNSPGYAGHIMPHVAPKPNLPELVLSSILIADENGLFIFSLCFFISSQTEPYLAIAASHNHGITYQRAAQQCFGSSWVCGGPGHYNARENFKSTAPILRFWVLLQ